MTHATVDRDNLYRDVEAFVREKLGDVVSVEVGEDHDYSGDLFVTANVVVEGSTKMFVRQMPSGFLRHFRAMLLDRGLDAFPSVTFVSSAEAH